MPFDRKPEPTPVRSGEDVFAEEYRRAVNEANAVPPPGSDDALAKGCICPILANAHGRGYYGQPGVFVYTEGCPLHCPGTGQISANNKKDLLE